MDWFEHITGFREAGYDATQKRLSVIDGRLRSDASDRTFAVGELTLPSLAELRAAAQAAPKGSLRLSLVQGDVRAMHANPANRGALFQVASQFNLLEMTGPEVSPEQGVARYAFDRTQGPACAIAAGAATIYRNYLVPLNGGLGQSRGRQIDAAADLGLALARRLSRSTPPWTMRNGYLLPGAEQLSAVSASLAGAAEEEIDALRAVLRIGLHSEVEVTDGHGAIVSQAFCSALPVAYAGLPSNVWAPFARLVLEAAYEATLLAAAMNARRGGSPRVLLTALGGGAFGNVDEWIGAAMARALDKCANLELDVVFVAFGVAPSWLGHLLETHAQGAR
jgi:hypothetical protein